MRRDSIEVLCDVCPLTNVAMVTSVFIFIASEVLVVGRMIEEISWEDPSVHQMPQRYSPYIGLARAT